MATCSKIHLNHGNYQFGDQTKTVFSIHPKKKENKLRMQIFLRIIMAQKNLFFIKNNTNIV